MHLVVLVRRPRSDSTFDHLAYGVNRLTLRPDATSLSDRAAVRGASARLSQESSDSLSHHQLFMRVRGLMMAWLQAATPQDQNYDI